MNTRNSWIAGLLLSVLPALVQTAAAEHSFWQEQPGRRDERPFFQAEGALTTSDPDSSGFSGPNCPVNGINWDWTLTQEVDTWAWDPAIDIVGAHGACMKMSGAHRIGPCPRDQNPNLLPTLTTEKQVIPLGKKRVFYKEYRVDHVAPPERHRDLYGFRAEISAAVDTFPKLTGPVTIRARHRSSAAVDDPLFCHQAIGTNRGSETTVSFDASSGILHFQLGSINILNRTGETMPGIDPSYGSDPVLESAFAAGDLLFLGASPDGGFLFGPGNFEIFGPWGRPHIAGMFPEYVIRPGTRSATLPGIGICAEFSTTDVGDPEDGPSAFLEDFGSVNLLGQGLSEAEYLQIEGIAFACVPLIDLAAATNGFTESVWGIPAAFAVSACVNPDVAGTPPHPQPPSSVSLSLLGPNPVSDRLLCRITLIRESEVRLGVYDALGRLVDRPADRRLGEGTHFFEWKPAGAGGAALPSGVYFLHLREGRSVETRRFTLIR